MKFYFTIITLIVSSFSLLAQGPADEKAEQKEIAKAWKKLDARPVPQWWQDAKFGIFIHWGPYSVPAFSKIGQYSEWYWENLRNTESKNHKEVKEFHTKTYGSDFTYPDFVPDFKCEFFDPKQWAEIFEESGAKYVVLTSKHHDGYTLWPSEEADRSWGRPWNSVETGPQRDLVGELTEAVNATSVRMGLYYSLYEWFNPLYINDFELFRDKHYIPQFKDVVNKYKPAVIFVDGEWGHSSLDWKSPEVVGWLYNDSPVKNDVVINDRWGKSTRHHHGGYYTTEYGSGVNIDHPWEENRGMAHSFGYSRTENLVDYNSSQELIYMLIDIVSRGGNFLLDIGPTADGRIPVIMQERLLDIGDWLKINGEAIYNTTSYKKSAQWSEGTVEDQKRGRYKSGYDIMKLTVEPEEGFATKEIFFTQKENALYAICAVLPDETLEIKDLKLPSSATITMLGREGELKWTQAGTSVKVEMPKWNPSHMSGKYAYTFKINGFK